MKQDTHDKTEVTSRRRGREDERELLGGSHASILLAREILSGRKSFISTNWRDCTFWTSLAGTGVKEDTRRNAFDWGVDGPGAIVPGGVAAVGPGPVENRGRVSSPKNVGMAEITAGVGSTPKAIERRQGR